MGTLRTSVLITAQNLLSPHLERINTDLERVNATIDATKKGQLTGLSTGLRNAGLAFTAFGAAATTAIAATVNEAGKFEQTKVAFTTMLGSVEAAQKTLDDLASFASRTPFTIQGVERSAKQLLAVGYNANELIPTLKSVGDVASGLSLGEDGLQRLIINLGQVRTQGKLTGRELRDFAVNGVPIMDELAKMMDKPKEAIAGMVEQGQITAPIVEEAFRRMTSEGGRFADMMDKQSQTMLGSFSNLQDSISRLAREFGQPFLAPLTAAFQFLANVVNKARETFASMPDGVKNVVAVLASVVAIGATVVGTLGLLMSQVGNLKIAWMALSAVFSTGATTLAAFAWPITLVVAGLTALYLWVTRTESGKKALAATIAILGTALTKVGTFIGNTIRLMQAIWNVTEGFRKMVADSATVAMENFARWFGILGQNISDGIGWLRKFASELYNGVVGAVKKTIEWLSKIPIIGDRFKEMAVGAAAAVSLMSPVTQTLADSVELVSNEYNRLEQESSALQSQQESLKDILEQTTDTTEEYDDTLGGGEGTNKAKEDAEKLAESIADLESTYSDSMQEINEKIFDLDNTHKEKMQSIRDEMQKVSDQVVKLNADYTKNVAEMQAGTAGKIVEEQEKINDLISKRTDITKELASIQRDLESKAQQFGGVSSMGPKDREDFDEKISKQQSKLDEVNAEIQKRQSAYDQIRNSGVVSAEELSEAQRRASLTDLQRFVEDQNTKKTELQAAHEEKLQQLDDEMAKLQEQADKEVSIYNIKRQDYEATKIAMQSWHDAYVANLGNMAAVTQKEVEAMKKRLEELRVISEIQALMKSQSSASTRLDARVQGGGTSIPQFANGGITKELASIQRDLESKAQQFGGVSSMGPKDREDFDEKISKQQSKLDEVNAEIQKRQSAYNEIKNSGIVSAEELAEAQRRASLTELQRFVEDQNIKKAEMQTAHEEKLQQLNDEMAKLQEQADKEVSIYNIKRADYEQTKVAMQSWHDAYVANLASMADVTQKQVDAMKKRLEELRQTISEIQALMKSQSSASPRLDARVNAGGTAIPQFANGGITRREGLFRAGEGDRPEAIVPLPDGRSIPVTMEGGGRSVSVSIDMSGMTVHNGADADDIVRRVKGEVVDAIINAPLESR